MGRLQLDDRSPYCGLVSDVTVIGLRVSMLRKLAPYSTVPCG